MPFALTTAAYSILNQFLGGVCVTIKAPARGSGKVIMASLKKTSRRELLQLGGAAAATAFGASVLGGCGGITSSVPPISSGCTQLSDVQHVVIFIQENRSFDHYFGSYRGVRGFADQSLAFQQPYPGNTSIPPIGNLLPYHLDTNTINAACTHDITHDWISQHQSWDNGAHGRLRHFAPGN